MTGKPLPWRGPDEEAARAEAYEPIQLRSPKKLRVHPQADLVPPMTAEEVRGFEADIAECGIQEPLAITAAGVVLDGRHRHRVALALGLERVPVRIVAPEDELDYMLRAAFQRRHLTKSKRAVAGVELEEYRVTEAAAATRKRANLRNSGLDVAALPHRGGRTRDHVAGIVGVSPRLIQDAKTVRDRDPVLLEQVRVGTIELGPAIKEIKRRDRYAAIGEAPPLPTGTFDVILADPPWQLGSPSSSGSPEQHYPSMPTEEIAALQIPVADAAALFIWEVTSLRADTMTVIDAWGFTFKSEFVWVKKSIGPGNYVRNKHEKLLIATRGNFPTPLHRPDSVVEAPRGRHSEKPKCFYELIEQMYPNSQRLELFARGTTRPGWTFWGNEVEP